MYLAFVHFQEPANEVRDEIRARLVEFNARVVPQRAQEPILIALKDAANQTVGGLSAYTSDDWLYTELLVVPGDFRGQGLGRRLVAFAEREARRRECHAAWIGTFSFLARGFYERIGLCCFGELADHPAGHSLLFMRNCLRPGQGA